MRQEHDRPMALAPEIRAQLQAIVTGLEAGDDVPPARSFGIEAQLQHAWVESMRAPALLQEAGNILGKHGTLRLKNNNVELQFWQRRAPVVPTTAD